MEPSNLLLVTEIVATLRDRVAPALSDDPWAASELRSVCSVLGLVAARMEHEEAFVTSDNAALVQLFADLAASGMAIPAVGDAGRDGSDLNVVLRSMLEGLLPEVHDGERENEVAAVRAYLSEASRRASAMYGPLTAEPPF